MALLLAAGAAAQELIGPYDTNRNGGISKSELTPFLLTHHPAALAADSPEAAKTVAEEKALDFVTAVPRLKPPSEPPSNDPEAAGSLGEVEA
ncbi:MAG TPA: hypothetical protein VFS60_06090, partial [Thermoanaerobaculia bacterium]|nr:hypothetical protein [Thermoanaerobaculia bacterium]